MPMLKAPLRFCLVKFMPIERPPKRVSFKLAVGHDLQRYSANNRILHFRQRPAIRASTRRWICELDTVVLPPADAADLVRSVPVGKHCKATGWTGDVLRGAAELDVQRATAGTINEKSVTDLSAATMAEPELADDMFSHRLCIGQSTASTLAQCAHELNPAASHYRRKTLLVAFRRQDHPKTPFAAEAGTLALIDEFDGKHGVISE
jgi:hypothetical protein